MISILSYFWTCHYTSIFVLFRINDAGQLATHRAAEPAEGAKKDGSFKLSTVNLKFIFN